MFSEYVVEVDKLPTFMSSSTFVHLSFVGWTLLILVIHVPIVKDKLDLFYDGSKEKNVRKALFIILVVML